MFKRCVGLCWLQQTEKCRKKDKLQQCQELLKEGQNPSFETLKLFADFRFFDEGEYYNLAKPKSLLYYLFHPTILK